MAENEITTPPTFKERMSDRIKKDMADLLTPEEIKAMVESTINSILFAPQPREVGSGFHARTEEGPSLLKELVKELLDEKVKEAVDLWVTEHHEEVMQSVDTVVKNGVSHSVMTAVDHWFEEKLMRFRGDLYNELQQSLSR